PMRTHDEYREALGLHALGSLESVERRDLESHLETCWSCLGELAELRATAGDLVLLAKPLAPSPERLQSILAALDAQAEGAPREVRPVAAVPARGSLAGRLGRRPFVWTARFAVAAVVAFLIFAQTSLLRRLDEAYLQIAEMRRIGAFVTSPGVSVLPLWGTETARGAHAKLAYEHATGRFMLFSSLMPAPPEGQRYQLWVISDRVRPAGAFSPESPDGTLRDPPPGDVPFLFGISLEPKSAETDEPTGGMVLMSGPVRYPR
ncbi:MAG: anti-sigma factor domain-containing protein, partial [Candidatus Binatia bacterium]